MQDLVYDVQRYYRVVAPYMDAELAGRGDEPLWSAIGHQHCEGLMMEIGCGGGRVTTLLAKAGARVVGIDISPELLARARRRLAATSAWLIMADVRRLALRTRFDAIVAPDDPFSHLTAGHDRDRALRTVATYLAPGGSFILDALWFSSQKLGKVHDYDMTVGGQRVHVTEHWRCDRQTHRCAAEYDYASATGPTAHAQFQARYWTPGELDERFDRAGLRIVNRWGSYDRQPWDEQSSEHLVVEAVGSHPLGPVRLAG